MTSKSDAPVNWAERALEKQERIKSERESQRDVFQVQPETPPTVQSGRFTFQTADELKKQEAAVTAARTQRSMRLVAGLLMCFGLVFFFSVP